MYGRLMRGRVVLAGSLAALGILWIGQGLGYIGGSFMSRDLRWAAIGAVCVIAAGGLWWSSRSRR